MNSKGSLIDRDVWPDPIEQFTLADHLARLFNQDDQNIERPGADMKWRAGAFKQSLFGEQSERTERHGT